MHQKIVSLISYTVCSIIILTMTGCSGQMVPHTKPKPQVGMSDPAMVDTAEAAVSVSRALNDLANVKNAQNEMIRSEQSAAPAILTRLITVDWSGPVEPVLRQVAQASQLHLKVLGHAPAIPVIVSIDREETSAYVVLQDIRAQVNDKATVVIFPTSGIIELHYL
jgi:defect-in-organelle-trafficking protein DotD